MITKYHCWLVLVFSLVVPLVQVPAEELAVVVIMVVLVALVRSAVAYSFAAC